MSNKNEDLRETALFNQFGIKNFRVQNDVERKWVMEAMDEYASLERQRLLIYLRQKGANMTGDGPHETDNEWAKKLMRNFYNKLIRYLTDRPMTDNKDIREKIVEPYVQQSQYGTYILEANDVYNCMDEYFEKMSMELLEWMSVNDVDCAGYLENKKSGKKFWYKGEWITAEELFKNFL